MKRPTLQKKRRPARAKKGLTLLYSKTRRKKHRVSAGATADLGSEVPNLGVARALFIILLLHVAAIVAIFLHNRMTDDAPIAQQKPPSGKSTGGGGGGKAAAAVAAALPQVQEGEDYYFVGTGDTYERIAENRNVDVRALKALNMSANGEITPLSAGMILRIPPVSRTMAAAGPGPEAVVVPEDPRPTPQGPISVVVTAPTDPVMAEAPAMEEEEVPRAVVLEQPPAPRETAAVQVRPRVSREAAAAAALPGQSGERYTVKSGDTVWSISNRFKVSRSKLLELNGISDPRKLRVGMTLVIPTT